MNLRDLEYLIAVADTHHFGKAAERCFVSQPTLSAQIKKVEEFLGVAIFERTKRSVTLTPVGQQILDHARQSIEQVTAMKQVASAYRDPLAGPLRLGLIPTLSPYLIPLILKPLKKELPQMTLRISEETTNTLEHRLRDHEIDAAILATPMPDDGYEEILLFDEPFWLVHPRKHELYTKEDITRHDLRKLKMLFLSEEHCLTAQAMDVCRIKERSTEGPMEDLRAFGLETLVQLVAAGFGCTLVPALSIHGSWMTSTGVIARKLEMKDAFRRIRLVYRASFPRYQALIALSKVINDTLPNTVRIHEIKS